MEISSHPLPIFQTPAARPRDPTLDTLRGLSIVWVIFVHCLYWFPHLAHGWPALFKSFFLLEMPLIFFLAGWSNALARRRSLREFYLNRLQRIFIPYVLYAAICLGVVVLTGNALGFGEPHASPVRALLWQFLLPFSVSGFSVAGDCRLLFLWWAVWFVPIYLLVVCAFPLLHSLCRRGRKNTLRLLGVLLFANFLLLFVTDKTVSPLALYLVKNFCFYSFWMTLGVAFQTHWNKEEISDEARIASREKRARKIACRVAGVSFAFLAFVCFFDLQKMELRPKFFPYALDMQGNKFPPNFIFLAYSLGVFSLFFCARSKILKFLNFLRSCGTLKIFDFLFRSYIKNGYAIVLFHPFAFVLLYVFIYNFGNVPTRLARGGLILDFVFVFVVSALLGMAFGWCEKIRLFRTAGDKTPRHSAQEKGGTQ
ncbi:MAG: acyltransferase [Puniceicoccales bacterium]|jgi:peptidoglycan/LPS O-acetylase OafA/YrhL|nr:acyltransferase [Puniceicoccales bacterium]